eukprot:jgi/Galph1/4064/GphlegSOOS_G2721.1
MKNQTATVHFETRYSQEEEENAELASTSWLIRLKNKYQSSPLARFLGKIQFRRPKRIRNRERRSSTVDSFRQAATVAFGLGRRSRSYSATVAASHGQEARVVTLNNLEENAKRGFCSNYVSTTRYRWWSFIPQNLYEQFRRWVMMYFLAYLIINILSGVFPQIAVYSTPSGVSVTAIVPLSLVVGVTMIKAAVEDIFRFRNDLSANSKIFHVVRDGFRVRIRSSQIHVGDIIVMEDNETVPADIVALSAAREDGVILLETSALDGETNLKRHLVLADTANISSDTGISNLRGELRCEPPSIKMNSFAGITKLEFTEQIGGAKSKIIEKPISKDNLLLRGAIVRNSGWLYGIVVYTGMETKMLQQWRRPKSKFSLIEKEINRVYIVCFVYLVLWCFALGLAAGIKANYSSFRGAWYLGAITTQYSSAVMGILGFFANVVMSGTVVPIAVYITLELARSGLMIFLHWDDALVTYRKNKKSNIATELTGETEEDDDGQVQVIRAEVRNSDLETELGQVSHIFSDKTGTLTMNIMEFRKCYVKGNVFQFDSELRRLQHLEGKPEECKTEDLANFLRGMAICHSVLTNNVGMKSSSFISEEKGSEEGLKGLSSEWAPASPKRTQSTTVALDEYGYQDARKLLERKRSYLGTEIEDTGNISSVITPSYTVASSYKSLLSKWKQKVPWLLGKEKNATSTDQEIATRYEEKEKSSGLLLLEKDSFQTHRPGDFLHPKNVTYEGSNTDEMEFVKTAALSGYRLALRTRDALVVEENNNIAESKYQTSTAKQTKSFAFVTYKILASCDFSSERKRMSIIVQTPDQRILLFVKGAESVILPRVSPENRVDIESSNFYVGKFAKDGLRTLVFAQRELSAEYFQEWQSKLHQAELALYDREKLIYETWDVIESDLNLLGVTAVEDRLQDDVPETINYLRQCGIRIWLLTGDKRETAINVGVSSGLIGSDAAMYDLDGQTESEVASQLSYLASFEDLCQEIEMDKTVQQLEVPPDQRVGSQEFVEINSFTNSPTSTNVTSAEQETWKNTHRTLIVEGETLTVLLLHFAKDFVSIASNKFDSVICCRTRPMDKAWVVRTCKTYQNETTLSVGDGGNDVPMILEAHVGVGIAGYEGAQAARSADFSIGEFRHLRRLIAIYGRYANVGISQCLKAIFYKDFVIFTGLLWYNIWCQLSSEAIANTYYELLYDLLYTGLAPLVLGWFERDVPASAVLRYPAVYKSKSEFTLASTVPWLLSGFWHSIVLSFVPVLALYNSADATDVWNPQGYTFGLSSLIVIFQFGVEIVVLGKISLETLRWTWVNVLGIVFCLACFLIYLILFTTDFFTSTSSFLGNDLYWTWYNDMSSSAYFYFVLLIIVSLALLPDFILHGYRNVYRPRFWMVVRQAAMKEKRQRSKNRNVEETSVSNI